MTRRSGHHASLAGSTEGREPRWLLFVQQLPTNPSRARVMTWRRLQQLGALALKNGVYVLPNTPQAREDLEWLKTEIVGMKGTAQVFGVAGMETATDEDLVSAFRRERQ